MGDEENLLRAFSLEPAAADVVSVDEGAVKALGLKGGALRFDQDGCSVTRRELLLQFGGKIADVLSPPRFVGLAIAGTAAVRGLSLMTSAGEAVFPFSVHPDPLPGATPRDKAHALIQVAEGTFDSKTARRKAIDQLARRAFAVLEETQ